MIDNVHYYFAKSEADYEILIEMLQEELIGFRMKEHPSSNVEHFTKSVEKYFFS